MPIRSLLYVPVSSERFLAKAHERGADAIILDLEDAVAPAQKDISRGRLVDVVPMVGRAGAVVFVRINSEPERVFRDAEAACRSGAAGLFVTKARDPAALAALGDFLFPIERGAGRPPMWFVPMIEDAGAIFDARALARASPRIVALITGGEDIATALGAQPTPEVLRLPKLLVHYRRQSRRLAVLRADAHGCRLHRSRGDRGRCPRGPDLRFRRCKLRPPGGSAGSKPGILALGAGTWARPCNSSPRPSGRRPRAAAPSRSRAAWSTSRWCGGPARSLKEPRKQSPRDQCAVDGRRGKRAPAMQTVLQKRGLPFRRAPAARTRNPRCHGTPAGFRLRMPRPRSGNTGRVQLECRQWKNGGRNQVRKRPQISTPTHMASEVPAISLIRGDAVAPGASVFISAKALVP